MTEAQNAHFEESQMSFGEFRELFNSHDGLTPAQRIYGEESIEFVYGVRQAPRPRDAVFFDTQDRSGNSYWERFDATQADWYPELEAPQAEVVKNEKFSDAAGAILRLVA